MKEGLHTGADGLERCWWQQGLPEYAHYHDTEWGYPVSDDRKLFEKICLEGFQSGLSWITVLRKRDHFRAAFQGFDPEQVVNFKEERVVELLQNPGIIRHRGKIESTIHNARKALDLMNEKGSLAAYFWSFEPPAHERPSRVTYPTVSTLAQTPTSVALSKDLKKRGWKFVGPVTMYAFMQAMGLVNDHLEGCHCRVKVLSAREQFVLPC
ncbi:MAG: DNA-3-methyladenine glycosylase I [Saprospiraceae bacterium]